MPLFPLESAVVNIGEQSFFNFCCITAQFCRTSVVIMRGPATMQATITIFCIFCFKVVARGLDDVSKNRLNFADVQGIILTFSFGF